MRIGALRERRTHADVDTMHGSALRERCAAAPVANSAQDAMKTTIICDKRDETGRALDARILAHMEGPRDDASFDRLALDVFAYQYERNAPYRRYCAQIGCDPSRAASWRDIPAVPSGSFADARLACFPPERAAVTFVS